MTFEKNPQHKWKRKIFDESTLDKLSIRERSEIETDRDLAKPIEQLVCDVHEETHNLDRSELENIASAQKRMVSMMARLSISNDHMTKQMIFLTWAIALMTLIMLGFTYLMLVK